MNQITPDGKQNAPRLRPLRKTPLKSNGRLDKSQVEGKVAEANPDLRSITGSRSLNEIGTPVGLDQLDVTAPPDSPSPLKKIVPKEGKEPSKPKKPSATGYGPSATASSTATEGIESQQRQQNDDRSVRQ